MIESRITPRPTTFTVINKGVGLDRSTLLARALDRYADAPAPRHQGLRGRLIEHQLALDRAPYALHLGA